MENVSFAQIPEQDEPFDLSMRSVELNPIQDEPLDLSVHPRQRLDSIEQFENLFPDALNRLEDLIENSAENSEQIPVIQEVDFSGPSGLGDPSEKAYKVSIPLAQCLNLAKEIIENTSNSKADDDGDGVTGSAEETILAGSKRSLDEPLEVSQNANKQRKTPKRLNLVPIEQNFEQNSENQQQPSSVETDNSVASLNRYPKRQSKQRFDLSKHLNKKRRIRHEVHGIVYEVLDVDGDIHFLTDWKNWEKGPSFVKIEHIDRYAVYYHKHCRNKALYDKWVNQVKDFAEQIKCIWSKAQELENKTEDEVKVIDLFKERFGTGDYDLDSQSEEKRLWHTWHLYNFKRFLDTREKMSNRPEGNAWSYGHLDYLRICRHVGEKENIEQFSDHVPEQ